MRLLLTRPAGETAEMDAQLRRAGHVSLTVPMLRIEIAGGSSLNLDGVQAVLATSGNGVRALAQSTTTRTMALCCVGPRTAAVARDLGFTNVMMSDGNVARMATVVRERFRPDGGRLLYITGDHVAGDLAGDLESAGFVVERQVGYRAVAATELPEEPRRALATGAIDAVVLMSVRTAQTFVRLIESLKLAPALRPVDAICISPAVAAASAALPWHDMVIAERTDGTGVLGAIEMAARGRRSS